MKKTARIAGTAVTLGVLVAGTAQALELPGGYDPAAWRETAWQPPEAGPWREQGDERRGNGDGADRGDGHDRGHGRGHGGHGLPVPDFTGTDPSIPSPGYPDFWSANLAASLTSNPAGSVYTLSIQEDDPNFGVFNFPSGAYVVGHEQVDLTVHFDSTGHLITSMPNTFEVEGTLRGSSHPSFGKAPVGVSWGAQPMQTLFSANLTAVTVDSADEALGFKTTDFGGWANQPQFTGNVTSESLWLYSLLSGLDSKPDAARASGWRGSDWDTFLADLVDGKQLKPGTFFGIGAIATVPLPAALWLLGSGLLGLGGLWRRRRSPH